MIIMIILTDWNLECPGFSQEFFTQKIEPDPFRVVLGAT